MAYFDVFITLILAILTHGAASIWWASKINQQIKSIGDSFVRLDRELEKRDVLISATFKQIDSLKDRMTRVEANCFVHKEIKQANKEYPETD